MGNGTIKRCGLVRESVSLCRQVLKSYAQAQAYVKKILLLIARETVSPGCSQIKMQNSRLLQHGVCLHSAMLPALTIMN